MHLAPAAAQLVQAISELRPHVVNALRHSFSTGLASGITTLGGAALILALTLSHAPSVQAQSVDSCMSARLADALKTCQAIIDNGSRNADVYWKLSSAQYQDGQQALANKTLSEALRLHPGDAKLQTLRDIIASDSAEQALIARSAQLNQSSIDKGAMKIACLTKSGELAISACKRRLELTDVDGDRIRARLATLTAAQNESRIATAPVAPRPVPEPTPEPIALAPTPEPVAPAIQNPAPDVQPIAPTADPASIAAEARRAAYRTLVTEVQTRLNGFGLNAGLPDGVPGNRTRQALTEFYTATGMPVITSISDLTLEDLIAAEQPFQRAESLLQESRLALTDGNVQLAVQKLNAAKNNSGLVQIPPTLERDIQSSLIAAQSPSTPAPLPAPVSTPSPAPAPQTTVNTAAAGQQNFSALMSQIKTLQGQIQRQQAEQANQLTRLRSAL